MQFEAFGKPEDGFLASLGGCNWRFLESLKLVLSSIKGGCNFEVFGGSEGVSASLTWCNYIFLPPLPLTTDSGYAHDKTEWITFR